MRGNHVCKRLVLKCQKYGDCAPIPGYWLLSRQMIFTCYIFLASVLKPWSQHTACNQGPWLTTLPMSEMHWERILNGSWILIILCVYYLWIGLNLLFHVISMPTLIIITHKSAKIMVRYLLLLCRISCLRCYQNS